MKDKDLSAGLAAVGNDTTVVPTSQLSHVDDGGPAFPFEGPQEFYGGISKRDYFAATALPLAWAIEQQAPTGRYSSDGMQPTYEGAATRAYFFADAMLKERAK